MKNLIITVSLLFCMGGAKAQITLEHTYNGGASNYTSNLRIIHFSAHGYMYEYFRQKTSTSGEIYLYNLNHSFYESIPVTTPLSFGTIIIMYVSDSLFNTNPSNIEYLIYYQDVSSGKHVLIKDDLNNTLFAKDIVQPGWMNSTPGGYYPYSEPIFFTPTGYKMILYQDDNITGDSAAYVYSLPGALPCSECANGVVVSSVAPETNGNNNGALLNAYPNPAKNSTTIQYELPVGVNQGEIVFYDLQGRQVKTFTVDRTFNDIVVSTADLAAGTYFYILRAGGNYVGSKRMVIIK